MKMGREHLAGASGRSGRMGRITRSRAVQRCSSGRTGGHTAREEEQEAARLSKQATWELRALAAGVKWDQLTGEVLLRRRSFLRSWRAK